MNDDNFKMANTPRVGDASDSLIEKLFSGEFKLAEATNAAMERVEKLMSPKLNAETLANGRTNELWSDGVQLPRYLEPYLDCNGKRCWRPKGEGERMRAENAARQQVEFQRHTEQVHQEVTTRRLDEIDPDWRDHYKTMEAAERAYLSNVSFDDGLEDDPR